MPQVFDTPGRLLEGAVEGNLCIAAS